jgi:hypothetical protein
MKSLWLFLFAVLMMVCVATSLGQIPRLLSYQGILADSLGNPKPDGSYSLTFRLYDAEFGGSAFWTETKTLQVKQGLFSTVLGDQVPFGASIQFDKAYWLGIQVAANPELSPRVLLTAVGYSLNSTKADTAAFAMAAPAQVFVDSARITGTVADNAITSAKIANGTIKSEDVEAGFVAPQADTALYALSAPQAPFVDSAGIAGTVADNAITSAKIANGTIKSEDVEAGFVAPIADTAMYALSAPVGLPSGTTGQTLRRAGSNWVADSLLYNNGNDIGIGTTLPGAHLDVHWEPPNNNINPVAVFRNTGGTSSAGAIGLRNNNNQFNIGITAGNAFGIAYNNNISLVTDLFRMTPTGDVGIGTITPLRKLDVNGAVHANDSIIIGSPTQNGTLMIDGATRSMTFNTDVAGDASVQLPDSSVSSLEILDEPGIAVKYGSYFFQLQNLTTNQIVDSITINVPAAGKVIVDAVGYALVDHVNGTTDNVGIHILADPNGDIFISGVSSFVIPAGLPAYTWYRYPFACKNIFNVSSAGSLKLYLVVKQPTGGNTGSSYVAASSIQATYYPTVYGNTPVAVSQLSKTADGSISLSGGAQTQQVTYQTAEEFNSAKARQMGVELDQLKERIRSLESQVNRMNGQHPNE